MRFLIVLAVCTFAFASAAVFRGCPELDNYWHDFKGKHGKKYKNAAEETERRRAWEANRDQIEKHNKEAAAGLHTYTLKENHMADWTADEETVLLGFKGDVTSTTRDTYTYEQLTIDLSIPNSVDLRNHSCMSPIQNQGQCGSCWAFGATAVAESGFAPRVQLVDCDTTNSGCGGGNPTKAWWYVQTTAGQANPTSYPYTSGTSGVRGTCKYTSSMGAAPITGTVYYYLNATDIQWQLAYDGPVAAIMHVVDSFMSYGSGVYSETACNSVGTVVNHIVTIVGYGTQDGIPYWIIRNSWAPTWGLDGYALIKRGSNMCNIETYISYPLL